MSTAVATPKDKSKDTPPRDAVREAVETVVFVVVLVLMLKLFVTEAFVIPTGSMAETLYGYQKIVDCPQCAFRFPVNSHTEVEGDPATHKRNELVGYCCPNCRFQGDFREHKSPSNRTGDRVLVLKPLYHLQPPKRGDVVVFKFPKRPQENQQAANYIKRAMGFGGETVAIFKGELFTTTALQYPAEPGVDPNDLWRPEHMFISDEKAVARFDENRKAGFPTGTGGFEIVRKGDEQVLADARVVWDNDHQPKALKGRVPPRWTTSGGWAADDKDEPKTFTHSGDGLDWLRYKHLVVKDWTNPAATEPDVVRNFLGYNAGQEQDAQTREPMRPRTSPVDDAWVGDLHLECEADFTDGAGEVVMELSKGAYRYQARFAGGTVTIGRSAGPGAKDYATRPTKAKSGKHTLRFANVDSRLRVWVDGKAVAFGADADYSPAEGEVKNGGTEGWTTENDRDAPASIGAKGGVSVAHVKVQRDIYYAQFRGESAERAETYYVQPDHYLCLGDNSAQSSDGRDWGLVPDRLLLGKAVFVFWPMVPSPNRVGFIK